MATTNETKTQSGKSVFLGILGFIIGVILLSLLIKYLLGV